MSNLTPSQEPRTSQLLGLLVATLAVAIIGGLVVWQVGIHTYPSSPSTVSEYEAAAQPPLQLQSGHASLAPAGVTPGVVAPGPVRYLVASADQEQILRRAMDDLGLSLEPQAAFVVVPSPLGLSDLLDMVTREDAVRTKQGLPNIVLRDLRPPTSTLASAGDDHFTFYVVSTQEQSALVNAYLRQQGLSGAAFLIGADGDVGLSIPGDATIATSTQWRAVNTYIVAHGGTPVQLGDITEVTAGQCQRSAASNKVALLEQLLL